MDFKERCEKKIGQIMATSPVVVDGVPSGALKAIVRELVILEMKCEELLKESRRPPPKWSDNIEAAMKR